MSGADHFHKEELVEQVKPVDTSQMAQAVLYYRVEKEIVHLVVTWDKATVIVTTPINDVIENYDGVIQQMLRIAVYEMKLPDPKVVQMAMVRVIDPSTMRLALDSKVAMGSCVYQPNEELLADLVAYIDGVSN